MIGIITAMEEELEEVRKVLQELEEEEKLGITFYKGIIAGKNCVLSMSGVGKVNAARTTQIMIDKYNVERVINVGVAGACVDYLNIGDIVIGDSLYQHDFDISVFDHSLGYIPMVGDYVKCLKSDIDKIKKVIDDKFCYKVYVGAIASGDQFVSDRNKKMDIYKQFKALCCEMEGASIAQVCFLSSVPFIIIRSISDTLSDEVVEEYSKFLEESSKRVVKFLERYLSEIM